MASPLKAITILQWNLNFIHRRKAELLNLIKEHDPVVILLQETRLTTNSKSSSLPNYTIISKSRDSPNGGSLIAIKTSTPFSNIQSPNSMVHTAITIPIANNQLLHIFHIYNPPTATPDLSFVNFIPIQHYLIAGDFNAHHPSWQAK